MTEPGGHEMLSWCHCLQSKQTSQVCHCATLQVWAFISRTKALDTDDVYWELMNNLDSITSPLVGLQLLLLCLPHFIISDMTLLSQFDMLESWFCLTTPPRKFLRQLDRYQLTFSSRFLFMCFTQCISVISFYCWL